MIINKILIKIKQRIIHYLLLLPKIYKYKLISDCKRVKGKVNTNQAYIVNGKGRVEFSENITIGILNSPFLFSGYCYFEVRNEYSRIFIGNNSSVVTKRVPENVIIAGCPAKIIKELE